MKIFYRAFLLAAFLALPSFAFGEVIADSAADWSTTGAQGENGWSYGLYDASNDADGTYAAGDFQQFEGPDYAWTDTAWDFTGGNVPWTTISQDGGHPNGDNNGVIQYAVRRWESDHAGDVTINFSLAKQNVNCGNGTTAIVYHNGAELGSVTVEGGDGTGLSGSVMASLAAGDTVDLALSPLGTDGTFADGCDGSAYSMQIEAVPEPGSAVLLLSGLMFLPRRRRR